jgi:hypothetical protein
MRSQNNVFHHIGLRFCLSFLPVSPSFFYPSLFILTSPTEGLNLSATFRFIHHLLRSTQMHWYIDSLSFATVFQRSLPNPSLMSAIYLLGSFFSDIPLPCELRTPLLEQALTDSYTRQRTVDRCFTGFLSHGSILLFQSPSHRRQSASTRC